MTGVVPLIQAVGRNAKGKNGDGADILLSETMRCVKITDFFVSFPPFFNLISLCKGLFALEWFTPPF